MPTTQYLQAQYPALALFAKEKGWRCGKSFISYRSKCYKNPKTGKIATKTILNKKTGRKNKIKVGLDYKEYQKARKAAIKKKGQGKRVTDLEKKYISDAKRLAKSTVRKKKRAAGIAKPKQLKGDELNKVWNELSKGDRDKIYATSGADKYNGAAKTLLAKNYLAKNPKAIANKNLLKVKQVESEGSQKVKQNKEQRSPETNKNEQDFLSLDKGGSLWKNGYPYKRGKTRSQIASILKFENRNEIDAAYKIVESVDNDSQHKKYLNQLTAIADEAGYEIKGDKQSVVRGGYKSDVEYFYKLEKKQRSVNKTTQSKSQINNYEDYKDTFGKIKSGDITAEEIKAAALDLRNNETAVKADLNKLKKAQLIKMSGWGSRPSDKKERLVDNSYERLEELLLPPGGLSLSYSYDFGVDGIAKTKANRHRAIDKKMEGWTDEVIKESAVQRNAAKAEKEKAIADPKTIDDFRTLVREKGLNGLKPAQRRTYEELVTIKSRDERKKTTPSAQAIELPANKSFKLSQTKHTKKGHDVYVASLAERVDRSKYQELNSRAKTLGGYYSRYGKDGAVPGFQFRDEETARKFMGLEELEGGDSSEVKQAKQSNSLRTNAERMIERNEEKLNQPRLMNTARRASMGANVEDDARGEIAIAKTMLKLADAKEDNTVQFLDRVSAGTDVRQLSSILTRSRYMAARKISEDKYPGDDDYYKRRKVADDIKAKPIDDDTIEYAEYPYPSIHKDNLRNLLTEARSQGGMKLLVSRLDKKYKAIANKDRESVVDFKSEKEINDFKKLMTANYTSTNKYHVENSRESIKDYQRVHDKLDLKTPYELRAGLREFNRLRSSKAAEDPIKVLERDLVGRKIDGYFPTPKPLVDKMLDLADLKPGQRVLEPSAGKGNIADEIRKAVGNDTVQTIEIDRDLSKILDQKGYNNRRDNFLNLADEEYDRIVMNPPFEKLQDVDHLKQAYNLLAPGGKVVSVMSESPFFQQQNKAKEFRKWLDDKDGYSEKLPENSFKNSERSTGVDTRLVVIEKPYEKKKMNYSRLSNIVRFAKGTKKCGKGTISKGEKCYTNDAGKVNYTYKINSRTGRRNKVKSEVRAKKRKGTIQGRVKKALKDPNSWFGNLKEKIKDVWQDIGDFIYNDDKDGSRLRKPNRSSSRKPFRTPSIETARQPLVQKAIARKSPAKIPDYLTKNLNQNQQQEVGMAVNAMNSDGGFLLANGTGMGKTRTQLATAKMFADLDKKVLIVSKSEVLKPKWLGLDKGVTGSFKDDAETMGISTKLTKSGKDIKKGEIGLSTYSNLNNLKSSVDKDTVLIFDEAHSFKNTDSARSKYGKEMMDKAHSVMYATATPADKPDHLDYLERANVFNGNSRNEIYKWMGLESYSVKKGDKYVQKFRAKKGVKPEVLRDRLNGLFDQMTENGNMIKREISLKGVDVGFAEMRVSPETRKKMSLIADAYKDSPNPLSRAQMLMHQRRQLETDKIPATVELVEDAIARGRSSVIFVSRVNESTVKGGRKKDIDITSPGTTELLKQELSKKGIKNISEIHGGTDQKPSKAMDDFQSGKNNVIIATIESGGTGINLDDRTGDKPRSLIVVTPPFSGVENVQAAGRVWRLKTKSYPEIDYIFSNTKVDNWNRQIISTKMQSLGAVVSGEIGKLDVDSKKMIAKLSDTNKSLRPPKPKKKRKINYSRTVNTANFSKVNSVAIAIAK